ncbi:alpha/beta fold hydrolase [Sphingosinicella microcystinivorans]|uniref:Alpha/beta hydrolase n=1 Tax=Sphingosinicella microcystinivorans TaxID=335406 RepID=A0AAD1D7L0_SPHMI|nr:alpha/beta hydrolase [Sphingosinicella microcystinivorans]RKS91363.1 pimeloyl-ACP methyl ester carboxylesterase [Sphingosinicella microcystinivorans]BBE34336.1 alpha/beta hydrolase [Sphingosinicella microcystinivorans]
MRHSTTDETHKAQWVDVEGGQIPLSTHGAGASAILFLHGWTLDHRIWQPQFDDQALAQSFRLVAIDRRGFGASKAPPDLDREPEDIIAVLDHLDVDRVILVGQSQAGRAALRFANQHPGRTAGLVLVGSPIGGLEPGPAPGEDVPLEHYRALATADRLDEMKQLWAAHPMIQGGSGTTHAPMAAMLANYTGQDLLAPAPQPGPDIGGLGAITAPALVITGTHDTAWRRRVGDAIAVALPHGTRAEIPEGGHLCNADAPAAFNRLLSRFAESVCV